MKAGAVALTVALGLWCCSRQPAADTATLPGEAGARTAIQNAPDAHLTPGIHGIILRAHAGEIAVTAAQGLTAQDLDAQPFQLTAFTAICSFRGNGRLAAWNAALARGCNALTVEDAAEAKRLPAGVRAHLQLPGLDWPAWMAANGIPAGQFAALVQTDTAQAIQRAGGALPPASGALLTLVPAWPFLDPTSLDNQPWFAGAHSTEERAATEGSYYGGCLRTLSGEIAAARARGWATVSLSWSNAPSIAGLPASWAWERIAGPVSDQATWTVPLIPAPTSDARVPFAAATLAQARARSDGARRRVRAAVHLAGACPEDARALAALPCFGGAEGIELIAGQADEAGLQVMLAALEGLALAKRMEPLLGDGATVADTGAMATNGRRPLCIRSVRKDRHAVMTYDPYWAEVEGERSVVIPAIAGLPGTSVRLPAGRQVRIFLLQEEEAKPVAATTGARPSDSASDDPQALAALARLSRLVPRFRVIDLPANGTMEISADATLSIDDLRGTALDDDPPRLGPAPSYKAGVGDGQEPAERSFPARGIAPFRFRHFTNEFNITGRGMAELQDYASAHGFNLVAFRPRTQNPHLPPGTGALKWLSRATPKDLDQNGRFDLIAERAEREDLATLYASDPFSKAGYEPRDPGTDLLMIDIEHAVLRPERLREQAWYPKDADQRARAAFEAKYYRGYGLMYTAAVTAARRAGYPQVSIYGWYTVPRTWWGLEKLKPDPASDWAWNAYGRSIYPTIDLIHPSVYFFYVAAQNVSYSLANIDLTRQFLAALPAQKRVRPYYWLRYHGGGATGVNWWGDQPIVDEEARAALAMAFFTGIDGLDLWDWFPHPRFAGIPEPREDKHLMVGQPFTCVPEGGGPAHAFRRYDVLHVLSCDQASGGTRFQLIIKDHGPGYGIGEGAPVYHLSRDALRRHLRPWLENAAAAFEGLALVHPFEYLLRHGTVEVDVPAQEQFAKTLPIVRRVRIGHHHVLITYDPNVLYAKLKAGEQSGLDAGTDHRLAVNLPAAGKGIELRNFAGHPGLTLRLPADDQVRIIVLRDR
jgi:hypothetical protein